MGDRSIRVQGAREHNLKGITVEIPRDQLVVITGLSGSGKSSLAFDTIYAEGQRRYVESLSTYARQFLDRMQKPDVEAIEGLPPTISIEQRSGHATPRSTVATSTEIYDFLRLLFARVGTAYCWQCDREISSQTSDQIIDQIQAWEEGRKMMLLAPVVRGQKGTHKDLIDKIRRQGFVRCRIDGEITEIRDKVSLSKNKKHDIEVVIDRLTVNPEQRTRLADSVETALAIGDGLMVVMASTDAGWEDHLFSEHYACIHCGLSIGDLAPRMFSFNSPYGACDTCGGLGTRMELDEQLIVPDATKSLADGAIEAWRRCGRRMTIRWGRALREFAIDFGVRLSTPFEELEKNDHRILMYGTKAAAEKKYGAMFEGVLPSLQDRFDNTSSDFIKNRVMQYMSELPCPDCHGARLKPASLAVRIGDTNIHDVVQMTIEQAREWIGGLTLGEEGVRIAAQVVKEISSRLRFLCDVGLNYLTLDRKSATLSGGEAQRIRLASQVGSGLVGVCYVLDEPTIGLHQRDNERLLMTLQELRDLGNTVIVVEHDEDTIERADYVLDIGPGAGKHGGEIVVKGTIEEVLADPNSLTAAYLSGREEIPVPESRRSKRKDHAIGIRGARANNLKSIDVDFPLGVMTCVTGVSGSGKSTLVNEILHKSLARTLNGAKVRPGDHDSVEGLNRLEKVIVIDQSPIGRTPRSNPATYTGAFDEIRKLFTETKEAKVRGYKPGRFSFNVKGGRCEACEGQGTKVIEMHFLPDVYVVCEACKGRRYNRETLEIRYKGKTIADVLDLTVEDAAEFFEAHPKIVQILSTLEDVGLGYIHLGQSSTTLSGGEAQRVKLASELRKTASASTMYILDEPTTGLHFADIRKLLRVLNRLVDMGNSMVIIEHNLHVIKQADHIVDLGPEGGARGGTVLATGTPEEIAAQEHSYTGQFLRNVLPQAVAV
jgi:excinuclease ABC subunit A